MAVPVQTSHVVRALAAFRSGFVGVALFSGLINILTLTGSIFMLAVYDRVLPSRSIPTLIALGGFAAVMYAFHGALEILRGRILSRIGIGMDEGLGSTLFGQMVATSNLQGPRMDALGPLKDIDQLRGFLGSPGPTALFDLPWMPIYLGVCFLFHPLIGITAIVGCVVLTALALMTEIYTRGPTKRAHETATQRNSVAEEVRRNAEAVQALGMTATVTRRWGDLQQRYLSQHQFLADCTTTLGTISKVARMMLQSVILAVGAYLVINQQATGGIMIAGSILMSRALAPVELAIGHWRAFLGARQAWSRLRVVTQEKPRAEPLAMPPPTERLEVESLSVSPPGSGRLSVHDVSFVLERGDATGIIGPSASGKSSIARALTGVWPPVRGAVRLDGIRLEQWPADMLGRQIGYLPQNVELLDGTVAENIARFLDAEPQEILEAAQNANVHELIARLPDGYQTRVGPGGGSLSAGQRQRIALARAMFRNPFLLVLDEPNSNLDGSGEAALADAILKARARGAIVVVIAHRPSVMAAVNKLLFMAENGQNMFGLRDAVLQRITPQRPIAVIRPAADANPADDGADTDESAAVPSLADILADADDAFADDSEDAAPPGNAEAGGPPEPEDADGATGSLPEIDLPEIEQEPRPAIAARPRRRAASSLRQPAEPAA